MGRDSRVIGIVEVMFSFGSFRKFKKRWLRKMKRRIWGCEVLDIYISARFGQPYSVRPVVGLLLVHCLNEAHSHFKFLSMPFYFLKN